MNDISIKLYNFPLLHEFQQHVLKICQYVYEERCEEAEAMGLLLVERILLWPHPATYDLNLEYKLMEMLRDYFDGIYISWLELTNRPYTRFKRTGKNYFLSCCSDPNKMEQIIEGMTDYILGIDLEKTTAMMHQAIAEYKRTKPLDFTLYLRNAREKGYEYVRDIDLKAMRSTLVPLFQQGYKIGMPISNALPSLDNQVLRDHYGLYKPLTTPI